MQIAGLDCGVDRLGYDFAGAGVGGMPLDHNRAARCQRCSGIATRCGEREREVRRAEDGHGANRALHHFQVRSRERLPVGQRRIMAPVEIVADLDVVGEQAQLPDGTSAFSLKTRLGQATFTRSDFSDRFGAGFDLICDRA